MDQDRKTYKRVRLLTGMLTPAVLAAALLVFAHVRDAAWEPGAQVAGICRELIAGTTEGRQALFGSCWVAPLPVLFYLPFAWLLNEPYAGWAAFFSAWLFVFWSVREAVKSTGQSAGRIILAQAAIAALAVAVRQPQTLQIAAALTVGLALLTGAGLADWVAYRRVRDVVSTGTSGAFLALCGFAALGPAACAVAALPFAACGDRETRVRFKAWALLGWLPLAYTLAVWLLMNRLVLGDSLFFLRSLGHVVPHALLLGLALLLPAAVLLPALVATWGCDGRREQTGTGQGPALFVLVSFAVALLANAWVLGAFDVGWETVALHLCLLAVLMGALGRLQLSPALLAVPLVAFVGASAFCFGCKKTAAEGRETDRVSICRDVEAYVNAQTPYGRVFVLGYEGLDLLRAYAGDRLEPNMDLHIGSLRRAYKGQVLYVLVPKPVGRVRAESVFWRFPDIYELGGERLLFAEAFGSWHLFQVVTAPTQEQLDEWKRAR